MENPSETTAPQIRQCINNKTNTEAQRPNNLS